MVTERALAVLFLTELATVTVSPTVALSGSTPSEAVEARTVSCGFWLPTAVAWAIGIASSSASPAKTTSRPILNVVIIGFLLDLLTALAPRHLCEVIRVGGAPVRPSTGKGATRWIWSFSYAELLKTPYF